MFVPRIFHFLIICILGNVYTADSALSFSFGERVFWYFVHLKAVWEFKYFCLFLILENIVCLCLMLANDLENSICIFLLQQHWKAFKQSK